MFLFSNIATLRGGVREPMAWATAMAKLVDSLVEPEISLWVARAGRPAGTVAFSGTYASRADLDEAFNAVTASNEYHELLGEGQQYLTEPPELHLRQLIYPEATTEQPVPVGSVVTETNAICANGRMVDAMAWGIEIAELVHELGGSASAFLRDVYGPFGAVTWFQLDTDMAALDAADAAVMSSPEFQKSVDGAGDLFLPGSGRQSLAVRVA